MADPARKMKAVASIPAHGITANQAADEFAASHWGAPRNRTPLQRDGSFGIRDGVKTYYVRLEGNAYLIEHEEE